MKMFLSKVQKNSLSASLYEWKRDLAGYSFGDEFIHRYLLPTNRKVNSIPCPRHKRGCGGCLRLKTALFGSEIRAFCPDRNAPDIPLERSSLIEYELNIPFFSRIIAEKMGFEPLDTVASGEPCFQIAMSKINQRKRIPVYLALYPYMDKLEDAVLEVLNTTKGAFVLLTMATLSDGAILNKLSLREVTIIDLADALSVNGNGEIIVDDQSGIKADIKEQTPKEQQPHVDLPPNTGWEQLQLTFPDNHTLRVTIGDRWYTLSYIEMGMKNHAGEPNVQWALLKRFSNGCGKLKEPMPTDALRKQIQYLNKTLCDFFKLPDKPIERLHDEQCYRMRIHMPGDAANSTYHHKYRQ